ncbi:putative 3'-5' exonuclease [Lyophyllum shimeji]|uniref:3'-5' exonuclease n=1 Tax=Lyophyllum shimeji TaxID=47721 RepID=A0A9P3UMK8_LYOSH|nr:putative 3'-5' exonuclease [Lyophyllum shimeji]
MSTPPQLRPYSWRNIHPDAALHYIRDADKATAHLATLCGPVGFDLEWKPTFTKNTPENPVALVQLANKDTILLIQISAMQEFPAKLKEFLESPDHVKAGVSIQNDVIKLHRDCEVSTRNCVDLSLLARCADNARWKGKYSSPLGLARLIEAYEDLALPKGKIVRSNWEAELTSGMTEYASNDAHAGFVLYSRLMSMVNAMEKAPKPVYYTFDAVRGRLCEPTGMHWNCYNPDYDPGPPPPPKTPKEPNARALRRASATRAFYTTTTQRASVTAPNHLIVAPSTTHKRHSTHRHLASQRYSAGNSRDASSSSSISQSHPQRQTRIHLFPPLIHRGPERPNSGTQPAFGLLPSHPDLFSAEAGQAPSPRPDSAQIE